MKKTASIFAGVRRGWKRLFRDNLSDFSINWTPGTGHKSNFGSILMSGRVLQIEIQFIRCLNKYLNLMWCNHFIFFNQKVKIVIKYTNRLVVECCNHSTIRIDLTNVSGVTLNTQQIAGFHISIFLFSLHTFRLLGRVLSLERCLLVRCS